MALQGLAGWIAAILVFATFSAKRMVPLRTLGVASNVAFVAYASMASLWPILILHSILLPLNTVRLRQAILCRSPAARADAGNRQDQQIAFVAANDNQQVSAQEIAISVGSLGLKPARYWRQSPDRGFAESPKLGWSFRSLTRSAAVLLALHPHRRREPSVDRHQIRGAVCVSIAMLRALTALSGIASVKNPRSFADS